MGWQRVWRGHSARVRVALLRAERRHRELLARCARRIQRSYRAYQTRLRLEAARQARLRVWLADNARREVAARRSRQLTRGAATRIQRWWSALRAGWLSTAVVQWSESYVVRFGQTNMRRRRDAALAYSRRVAFTASARLIYRVWRRHKIVTKWRAASAASVRDSRAQAADLEGMWRERRDAFNVFSRAERAAMYIQGAFRRHASRVTTLAAVALVLTEEKLSRRPSEIARRAAAMLDALELAVIADSEPSALALLPPSGDGGGGGEGGTSLFATEEAVIVAPPVKKKGRLPAKEKFKRAQRERRGIAYTVAARQRIAVNPGARGAHPLACHYARVGCDRGAGGAAHHMRRARDGGVCGNAEDAKAGWEEFLYSHRRRHVGASPGACEHCLYGGVASGHPREPLRRYACSELKLSPTTLVLSRHAEREPNLTAGAPQTS